MTTTTEERLSQLEGVFRQFTIVVSNMVTREEMRAAVETSENRVLAEMRAEIRAAELRIIKWNVGTIVAVAAVAIAAVKLLP